MDSYEVARGAALSIQVALRDGSLNPITDYDRTETLTADVWPGGARAVLFSAAADWLPPDEDTGALSVVIRADPAQTATLSPGTYYVRLWLDDNGVRVSPYLASIEVTASAGSDVAPAAYTTYQDLVDHARGWLPLLQRLDDGTGFSREQGRARSWIEDCAHAHFRVASMALVVGGYGTGPRRSGARSPALTAWLADDALTITDKLREACAKKALSLVCEAVVDGDQAGKYGKLADLYRSQAEWLAVTSTLELDTDGDGFTDVVIDLSSTDPL